MAFDQWKMVNEQMQDKGTTEGAANANVSHVPFSKKKFSGADNR